MFQEQHPEPKEAPKEIIELVERFERNLSAYKSQGYLEQHLRLEFINPFFEAMGWDVYNKEGNAPAYRDVIHEDSIKTASGTKAPDYCFTLSGRRMFFVEAKKPSLTIKNNRDAAFQLRRYAWSAKLPLSILTDFEEFAVYESRQRPKNDDKASVERIDYFTYRDYIDKWNEIYNVFSKEAIRKGSFDKFVESAKRKRGTAEVDNEFLKEMEGWRDVFARNIALRNPNIFLAHHLNYAVQMTIDRIIFLRMCEDRGIERYGQLQSLMDKEAIYQKLCLIFKEADEKYNSGLFHFKKEKGRASTQDGLTLNIHIDDKVLKNIIKRLYYPESPYEFSVLPPEILGNVYEQFLGKVIRLTKGHRAKIEEKPEVKKAGGVYYTPQYIVDYIVKNTVAKLLKRKSPKQISKIRILDPACGSGSFLLGAYSFLLDYHLNYYTNLKHPEHYKDQIYQGRGGDWFLTIKEKKRILLNNIYGVDIDAQAVEVTKLSLLLKVLEGESKDVFEKQQKLWRERALPDLGNNIKCGNSLIGPEIYDGGVQVNLFNNEVSSRINVFDWYDEFSDILNNGGFDVVISNPPYIRIQTMKEWAPVEVEFYKEHYVAASAGNYDIYVVFVERALELLNDDGRMGYILPHKFFQAKYGQPLRSLVSSGKHLSKIVHFGDQQVFDKATTYTCLLFLDKGGNDRFHYDKAHDLSAWRVNGEVVKGKIRADKVTENEWNFVVGPGAPLFERLSEIPIKLGDVADRIFQGLVTGADPVFVMEIVSETEYKSAATGKVYHIEAKQMHPLCKGSVNLRRYHVSEITKSILFPYKLVNEKAELLSTQELKEQFPNTWAYLQENRQRLEAREGGKWKHDKWYALGRTQNLSEMEQEKILTPSIANRASFTFDKTDYYYFIGSGGGGGGGYGITLKEEYLSLTYFYLLGLLNSKLIDWFLKQMSSPFRGGYYSYNRQYIAPLPIRTIDFSNQNDKAQHDKMVELVERMLDLHKRFAEVRTPTEKQMLQRQIDATDQQINTLVYELYGLTEGEIKIVEESSH